MVVLGLPKAYGINMKLGKIMLIMEIKFKQYCSLLRKEQYVAT